MGIRSSGAAAESGASLAVSLADHLPGGFVDGDDVDTEVRAWLTAVGVGGRGYAPAGTYGVELALVVPVDAEIILSPTATFLLNTLDLDVLGANGEGVFNLSNGSVLRGGVVDGNRDNHTGTPNVSVPGPEGVSLSSCTGAKVIGVEVQNVVGDGVDIDASTLCDVEGNTIHDCGGYAVHTSEESTRNRIHRNVGHDCGTTYSRGGFDQFTSTTNALTAHHNSYVGNVAFDNYRNYNIRGWGAQFEGNSSGGTTTGRDVLSGVVKERLRNPTLAFDGNADGTPDSWTLGGVASSPTYLADGWSATSSGAGDLLTQDFDPAEVAVFAAEGQVFACSCYAKKVSGTGTATLLITFLNSSGSTISSVSANTSATDWTEVALTNLATAPALTDSIRVRLFATGAGVFAFRDVTVRDS